MLTKAMVARSEKTGRREDVKEVKEVSPSPQPLSHEGRGASPIARVKGEEQRCATLNLPCMFVFGVLVTMIDSEAVELVGKGVRGGKRLAFSTASHPGSPQANCPQIHSRRVF